MVSTRYALVAAQMALARASSQHSRARAQKADTKGGFSKCRGISGSATLNRMQRQAPFSSTVDSRKSRPRRMLSLPAFRSAPAVASYRDSPPSRRGRAEGRRGVVHGLAKKLDRRGFRLLPLRLGVFAARRKDEVRRGMGFFVHVNLVVFGHAHAEFRFDGLFGPGEKTFSKVVVLTGSRYEEIGEAKGLLHGRPLHLGLLKKSLFEEGRNPDHRIVCRRDRPPCLS